MYEALLRKEIKKEFGTDAEDTSFTNLKQAIEQNKLQIPQIRFEIKKESILAVLPGNDAVFVLNGAKGKTMISAVPDLTGIKTSLSALSARIAMLNELGKDPAKWVREAAAPGLASVCSSLIEEGKKVDLTALEAMGTDTDWRVRTAAAAALASVQVTLITAGKDGDFSALTAMMQDPNGMVREAAASAVAAVYISLIRAGKNVDLSLFAALLKDPHGDMRAIASAALASSHIAFIEKGKEEYRSKLLAMCDDADGAVRAAARAVRVSLLVSAIGAGNEDRFPELIAMCSDPGAVVRKAAAAALASVYASLGEEGKAQCLSALAGMSADPDVAVRKAAAGALGPLHVRMIEAGKEIDPAMFTALCDDSNTDVRAAAAASLASVYVMLVGNGADGYVAALSAMCYHPNVYMRAAAAAALGTVCVPLNGRAKDVGFSLFAAPLADPEGRVRAAAVASLASFYVSQIERGKDVDFSPCLALAKDRDALVRAAAAAALGSAFASLIARGKEVDFSVLAVLKDDPIDKVRRAATTALLSLYLKFLEAGKKEYFAKLSEMCTDSVGTVRALAADALVSVSVENMRRLFPRYAAVLGEDRPTDLFSDYLALASLAAGESSRAFDQEYQKFLNDFRVVNERLPEDRRVNQDSFIVFHQAVLIFLVEIMGRDCFRFLRGFIASDPYPLRRFLDAFDPSALSEEAVVSLREFYQSAHKKDVVSFQKILEMLSAYAAVDKTALFTTKLTAGKNDSWHRVYAGIARTYIEELARNLEISVDRIHPQELERFPKKYIPRLNISMKFIKDNHPEMAAFYRSLLKSVFEGGFDAFMTDTGQRDQEGKALAWHNWQVREKMRSAGIDEKKWLVYDREVPFSFSDRALKVDPEDEIIRLTGLLAILRGTLTGPDRKYRDALDNALLKLSIRMTGDPGETVHTRFVAGGKEFSDWGKVVAVFKEARALDQLKKTLDHVQGRTAANIAAREAIGHIDETIDRLTRLLVNPVVLKELAKKRRNFTIRMWKRDPAHDLFMGDFTGCCMASNSDQHFEAMIEHLTDQAIQVAEVLDDDTGETMALAWLFLAVDRVGNPHLVIDNIEINDTYAAVQPLKERVKEQLIAYAEDVGREVGARSLLAGMFEYSKMNLQGYHVEKRQLEKLGGYLDPDEPYYLEALSQTTRARVHVLVPDLRETRPAQRRAIEPRAEEAFGRSM
jgi:HEAT repeat protein